MFKHTTLYKRTSTGAVQIWYMETDGEKYRTTSGQELGKHVTSAWTIAEGKNIGRSNETTPADQALLEVKSIYTKKVEQGAYFANKADIDNETYFEPMLAKSFESDRLVEGEKFFIQPKHNGVRCIANRYGLWSRKGKPFVNCPHIEAQLKRFFSLHPEAILDGELYNHDYRDDFEKLVSAIKKQKPTPATIKLAEKVVELHVYDYPSHKGVFEERWSALEEQFAAELPENNVIRRSPTWASTSEATIHGLHKRNLSLGYEGTMIRLNKEYENKRTYSLMKYKDFKDAEFEILNIEAGKGNWSTAAKIATLKHPNGNVFGAGIKGTKEYCEKLLKDRYTVIGKLGTVTYFSTSTYGVPIFPIFIGVRDYE